MTSPRPAGSDPFPVAPLHLAWARWWQDVFALCAQMSTAQWRFGATALEGFRPWLEPGALMVEQLAEQLLGAAQRTAGEGSGDEPPRS